MKLNERQAEIGRLIQRLKQLDVKDLASRFKTSAVTIRKDLAFLEKRGILQRTHGGAILAENVGKTTTIDVKLGRMVGAKQAIARAALDQVFDCGTVAVDAGSTTLALARLLKNLDACVVTNSLVVAQELSERESGSLVLLGGVWRRESKCFIGSDVLQALERMNIDVAFVGASGFSAETGFTCQNSMEAQAKAKILARAERKFIIADSTKRNVRAFATFARPADVDGLIIDDGLAPEARYELADLGLHVIVAQAQAGSTKSKKRPQGQLADAV